MGVGIWWVTRWDAGGKGRLGIAGKRLGRGRARRDDDGAHDSTIVV